jgi:hypothetical protein
VVSSICMRLRKPTSGRWWCRACNGVHEDGVKIARLHGIHHCAAS